MTDLPGLDVAGLRAWLRSAHPDLAADELTVRVIAGGRSNLTYAVEGGPTDVVLRRPPLGHVLATAHDMQREHRVIAALTGTGIPVPRAIDVVDDTDARAITGTVFFLMEKAPGVVLSRPDQNAAYTPGGLHGLGIALAHHLADLHAVDPRAVGLTDFGHPDGYVARQLTTWRRQLDASRSRPLSALDQLMEALSSALPVTSRTGIVHGDYRLDNVLVTGEAAAPRVSAILDWEMATLGDPLVDLGIFGLYWELASTPGLSVEALSTAVDPTAGYPVFDELVDAYATRAGIAPPDLRWYRAFAAFKLAVIAEGIHYRHLRGATVGSGFDRMGELVEPLARLGLDTMITPDNGQERP